MKNKKIVFLGLNGRGGTLHYSSSLASNFANYAKVCLLIPSYSNSSLINKKVELLKIEAPPSVFKTFLLSLNIFQHIRIVKQINSKNSDVINILDIHPWYVLWWPFLKGKKIVTINDPELHSGETGFINSIILKLITKFLLKNAEKIIVLGKKQKEVVKRLGYKQQIIVSRIGHYGFFTKNKPSTRSDPRTILFFGRIKEYKGLSYLLDSLIKTKKKFKLIIAGDGDLEQYSNKLKKISNNLEINQGFIPDAVVGEYFQRSSFVVMPYIDATQTGVVQIAYSFKKPVIATNVGSLPEVVINEKTGLIVEPRNVDQLRIAIEKFLENPTLVKAYGNNGYKFMKKEMDWKKIVEKLKKDIFD